MNGFPNSRKKENVIASTIEHVIPPIKPSIVLVGDIGESDLLPSFLPIK